MVPRTRLQNLEKLPENPHRDDVLMDKARAARRNLLGDVQVIEESDGVFAQIDMGRACITVGAEKRT